MATGTNLGRIKNKKSKRTILLDAQVFRSTLAKVNGMRE